MNGVGCQWRERGAAMIFTAIRQFQAIPATPRLLSPTAAATPAQAVPSDVVGRGVAVGALKSWGGDCWGRCAGVARGHGGPRARGGLVQRLS
jgi:hypothetical protein